MMTRLISGVCLLTSSVGLEIVRAIRWNIYVLDTLGKVIPEGDLSWEWILSWDNDGSVRDDFGVIISCIREITCK